MRTLLNGFFQGLLWLAAVCMAITLLSILVGIVGREVGFSTPGVDAYAGYAIAAALFMALPATLRNGEHIRVTLLLNRLTGVRRKATEYWCLGMSSVLSVYLAYYAVRLVWMSYVTHDISPSSDATPLWIPQIAMAVGCIGFAASFIEGLVLKLMGKTCQLDVPAEIMRSE